MVILRSKGSGQALELIIKSWCLLKLTPNFGLRLSDINLILPIQVWNYVFNSCDGHSNNTQQWCGAHKNGLSADKQAVRLGTSLHNRQHPWQRVTVLHESRYSQEGPESDQRALFRQRTRELHTNHWQNLSKCNGVLAESETNSCIPWSQEGNYNFISSIFVGQNYSVFFIWFLFLCRMEYTSTALAINLITSYQIWELICWELILETCN